MSKNHQLNIIQKIINNIATSNVTHGALDSHITYQPLLNYFLRALLLQMVLNIIKTHLLFPSEIMS